jgi:UDP-2,3-diacylglucosamine pyrophosphatase LpxH
MSDCHRGDGSAADEFAHNSLIYKCALEYYLKEGFTYIELGDAEELWENDSFEQIYITHTSVYDLLRRFHDPDPAKTRYLKVWGNHDEEWRDNPAPLRALFPNIQVHEAILLQPENEGKIGTESFSSEGKKVSEINGDIIGNSEAIDIVSPFIPDLILLLHGHQADPTCSGFGAKISRFLVRHVWSGLQRFGIGDPTRAAENPGRCDEIDDTLYRFAKGKNRGDSPFSLRENGELCRLFPANHEDEIIIAGHTHRPVFANLSLTERRFLESGVGTPGVRRKEKADPVYYNAGSCVHPRCITGIEITMEGQAAPLQSAMVPFDKLRAGSARQQEVTPMMMTPVITLAKWGYAAAEGASDPPYPLAIARTVLEAGKR